MSLCRLVRIRTFVAEARGAGEEAGAEADFQVLENSKGGKAVESGFFLRSTLYDSFFTTLVSKLPRVTKNHWGKYSSFLRKI